MFDVNPDKGLTLMEIADGVSVEDVKAATGSPFEVRFQAYSLVYITGGTKSKGSK